MPITGRMMKLLTLITGSQRSVANFAMQCSDGNSNEDQLMINRQFNSTAGDVTFVYKPDESLPPCYIPKCLTCPVRHTCGNCKYGVTYE